MGDSKDAMVDRAMAWMSVAWKDGMTVGDHLSEFVNVSVLDKVVPTVSFVQRMALGAHLSVEISVLRPTHVFTNSVRIALADLSAENDLVKKELKEFGSECRRLEATAVLSEIEGVALEQHRDLLEKTESDLGRILMERLDGQSAIALALFLTLAFDNGRRASSPGSRVHLGEVVKAVGERGRNSRLLVPVNLVGKLKDMNLVESVRAVPSGWTGHALLMDLSGGPTVRLFEKDPVPSWTREGDWVTVTWTERFLLEGSDRAQLLDV